MLSVVFIDSSGRCVHQQATWVGQTEDLILGETIFKWRCTVPGEPPVAIFEPKAYRDDPLLLLPQNLIDVPVPSPMEHQLFHAPLVMCSFNGCPFGSLAVSQLQTNWYAWLQVPSSQGFVRLEPERGQRKLKLTITPQKNITVSAVDVKLATHTKVRGGRKKKENMEEDDEGEGNEDEKEDDEDFLDSSDEEVGGEEDEEEECDEEEEEDEEGADEEDEEEEEEDEEEVGEEDMPAVEVVLAHVAGTIEFN